MDRSRIYGWDLVISPWLVRHGRFLPYILTRLVWVPVPPWIG